ncbi:MAG TPA: hypothetical protein VLV83_10690 [Acidobacteriota bacterium]|nr:hypothetical protein [Acidobacteriota bacterium]
MRIPGLDISAHTIADLYTSQAQQPHRVARPRVEKIDKLEGRNELKTRRRSLSPGSHSGSTPGGSRPTIRRFETYDLKAHSADVPVPPGQIFDIRV